MIDIVGDEANALAEEIYGTLRGVAILLAPLTPKGRSGNAECERVRTSVIRCMRKLEDTLEIPQDERFSQ